MQSYRDLIVWQKSMDLVLDIYSLTALFPKDEVYGITSQVRRAVTSIPANIAEGSSRKTTKEFLRFLGIANGSLAELETFITISKKLSYINENKEVSILKKTSEIGKIITSLKNSLKNKIK